MFLYVKEMVSLLKLAFMVIFLLSLGGAARADWKQEWETTLAAARKEGKVRVHVPPGTQYLDAIHAFQASYPKIKLVSVPGSGSQHSQRLMAERRAGKYLADAYIGGAGTGMVLYNAGVFDLLPPALILPEVKDQSVWFSKKHLYADPKHQHLFIMQGNVVAQIAANNTKMVNPKDINTYWDLLNSKWRGKIVAYDPTTRGSLSAWKAVYYNPILGPKFIRRLFSEMNVTIARDYRIILDWVAKGKYPLWVVPRTTEVKEAMKQGLPVDIITAPPEEGRMSGGWGQAGLINGAPHPNAAKVFINWLLSKKGQLQWQKKSDNNSLRMDIAKDMLSDPGYVPEPGGKYLIGNLPQYRDIRALKKLVAEAKRAAGKK